MKNKTKSKIVITMKNIDCANNLYQILKKIKIEAEMGGDTIIGYKDQFNKNIMQSIGHDIEIMQIQHIIFK